MRAPNPRSRLYTDQAMYLRILLSALTGNRVGKADLRNLETALDDFFDAGEAIAMPMARVGIYHVLRNLILPGQKVILSPYTISDVVNMVLCAGGIPLFADIEKGGTYNIDPNSVDALLSEHKDVGAVLVTHFYGLACDIKPILDRCDRAGIPVVEDAAQAFGTVIENRPVGLLGKAGIFSFGLLKNVTSFLGGAVLTTDPSLAQKIRDDITQYPPFPKSAVLKKMFKGATFDIATMPLIFGSLVYPLFRNAYLHNLEFFKNKLDTDLNPVSYNQFPEKKYAYQMWGVQGDIVVEQLPRVKKEIFERIDLAKVYHDGLKDLPDLVLPPFRTDGSHAYMYYPIHYLKRDDLALWMAKNYRDVQISHHRNCASMPCFSSYFRDCPNAETAAKGVIYLPTYPGYGSEQAAANVHAIRSYFLERKT